MLTPQQRKNIVRAARKNESWYDGEAEQDRLIEIECKKRGFELCHFYAESGRVLQKILNNGVSNS